MRKQLNFYIIISVLLCILSALAPNTMVIAEPIIANGPESYRDAHQLSEDEILEELFGITSEIELIKSRIPQIEESIKELLYQKENLEDEYEKAIRNYENTLEKAGEILRVSQRISTIDYVFSAKDFGDLIKRTASIREINKKTKDVLASVRFAKDEMEVAFNSLQESINKLETEKNTIKEYEARLITRKELLEERLSQLREEREEYESKLRLLSDNWSMLKLLFSDATKNMRTRIQEGSIAEDTVEVEIGLFGAKAFVSETKLNNIDKSIVFNIEDGYAEVSFPSHDVAVRGEFYLINPQTIGFKAKSGNFRGVALNEHAIEDLLLNGNFNWNLQAVIGKNQITGLKMKKDKIEMGVKIVF